MAKLAGLGKAKYAPWERAAERMTNPINDFIHKESGSGILLMICTAIALFLANGPWAEHYAHVLHYKIGFDFGGYVVQHTLHHWINDGLMALFFFVVGLEIKREVLIGGLSSPSKAMVPIIAAIGGMVVPAGIYAAMNMGGPGANGWGIPMATDIAFAVGVLVLLGDRIPRALLTFLMALAIVDDLGAVAVIAVFYTETISWGALGLAGIFFLILIVFNRIGVRSLVPHFIVGFMMWAVMLESGVHATIAGILGAWTVPMRARFNTEKFSDHIRGLMDRFDAVKSTKTNLVQNEEHRDIINELNHASSSIESPMNIWERNMHVPVAFIIIPLFALANAGVSIELSQFGELMSSPITLGIIAGLVVGKVIGIAGFSLIAVKMGIGQLPEGAKARDMVGIGLLGGIGFTMSIFIAELGFRGQEEALLMAKTGVLLASAIAGVSGMLWLLASRKNA